MATVLDVIKGAESDASAESAAVAIALAADKAAQEAADKAKASKASEASVLHSVGEVYVTGPDGAITTYDSPDGVNVQIGRPKDAASLALPDAPAS
jgi:hypothetical protein